MGSVMTLIVGVVALIFHVAIISDPNEGWPIAVLIRNTVGGWWVILFMAAFAGEHAVILGLVLGPAPARQPE